MAIEIFRAGMNDEIRAQSDRFLKRGREKRVVDRDPGPARFRPRHDGADIDDAHKRIAGCLDQYELWRSSQRRCERCIVSLIDEGDIELPLVPSCGKETIGARITIMRRDDQIIGPQPRENQVDRRHAGRRDDSAGAAFELRYRVGEQIAAGIAGPRIGMGSRAIETFEGKGARKIERRRDGAEVLIGGDTVRRRHRLRRFVAWHDVRPLKAAFVHSTARRV